MQAASDNQHETPAARRSWSLYALVAVFVVIQVSMWWPILHGRMYSSHDIQYEHLPRRIAYAVSLENGEAGFWYRWIHRGHSALFNGEAGVLHPGRFLEMKLFGPILGFELEMLLLHPAVLLGTLVYLRWRGYRWGSCLFGAILYTWGVDYVAHYGQVNHMQILAHLPWAALTWEACIVGRRRYLAAAGLAVVYTSMLLLGHPQMTYLVSLAVGVLGLLRGASMKWSREFWRGTGLAAAAVAVGVLLGAMQLWPSVHGLRESSRGALTHLQRSNYSAHPVHFLPNVAPYLTRSKTIGDWFYFDPGRDFLNNPSEYYVYFGLGLLVFLYGAFVLLAGRLRRELGLAYLAIAIGSGVVLVWLMTGKYGYLNDLLAYAPLVSQFRCPNRYKTTLVFLLAVAAAALLERLLRRDSGLTRRQLVWLAAPPVVTVAVLFCFARGVHFHSMTYHLNPLWERAVGPLLCLTVTAGLIQWATYRRPWALALVALLCVADLGIRGSLLMHDVPTREMAFFRGAYERMHLQGQQTRVLSDTQWPQLEGRLQANGYSGMPPIEPLKYSDINQIRLAGVDFLESTDQVNGEIVKLQRHLDGALPRLRLVPRLVHADQPLAGLDQVDLTTTARCRPEVAPELDGPPLEEDEGCEFVFDGSDRIDIRVHVTHPRLLLLSDTVAPDWKATVDGEARPILGVFDGALRGVLVNPGDQEVTMFYDPPSFAQGCSVSAVGGIGLLILLVLAWRDSRRKSLPPTPEAT